ncbi:hypothetical protein ACR0ST_08710 [Aliidiomarina sp. Khilg15.8]
MQLYSPLQLSEHESLNVGESHVLRFGPTGIAFYNRDHDLTNYVHSTVPAAANAFWLAGERRLLVQSESHELHLLDIAARRILETDSLGAEVKQVGVVDTLLFARTDDALMVISLKEKKQLSVIPVKVDDIKNLVFTDDHQHIGITADQCFTLYRVDGSKAVTFKRGDFVPSAARCLDNGTWLTVSRHDEVHWWNSDGTQIARLPWPVRIYTGVRLLENGHLLCTDGKASVFEVNAKGKVAAKYAYGDTDWSQKDSVATTAKGLSDTVKALAVVENRSATKQQLTRFKHNYNVIGFSVDQVEDEDGKVVVGASPKREAIGNPRVWNFFYRPNERHLRNQLVEEMRSISNVDDALVKEETALAKIEADKKSSGSKKSTMSIVFALLTMASIAGLVWFAELAMMVEIPEVAPLAGIGLFGLLFLITFSGSRKAYRHAREVGDALAVLDLIKVQTLDFKDKVKAYRGALLKQLPKVGDDRPSDAEMSEHVQKLLAGKIRQIALDECGLDEGDINSVDADGNEIRTHINEPGYLQFSDANEIPRAINPRNLYSFYLGPDNKPIFAVQFIQYFFLGANKIDAFTCFYDFINDEMIANESHTFYYRDVTNIGKRQIDFSEVASDAQLNNAKLGVEMKLVVASGDTIRINIATDETYRVMNKEVEEHAERESNNRANGIKDEIRQIEQSTDLSDEEKAEEIEDLQETLAQVEAEFSRRIDEHVSTHTETSQQIIQHVRGRLKELKEV